MQYQVIVMQVELEVDEYVALPSFGQLHVSLSTSKQGPWAIRAAMETGSHPSEPVWRQVRAIFP